MGNLAKIKQSHGLAMMACCAILLGTVLFALYFFGSSKGYLFLIVLLACPLMHYFAMKDMHKNNKEGCH